MVRASTLADLCQSPWTRSSIYFDRSTFIDLLLGNDIWPLNEFNYSFRNKLMCGEDSEFNIARLGAASMHRLDIVIISVHFI
jgi:hypothetical protein